MDAMKALSAVLKAPKSFGRCMKAQRSSARISTYDRKCRKILQGNSGKHPACLKRKKGTSGITPVHQNARSKRVNSSYMELYQHTNMQI